MNKTFKGLLEDGTQQQIRLSTNDGLTGYKIVKMSLICKQPGLSNQESLVKVRTIKTSGTIPTANATVNFDDPTLLAVGMYSASTNQKTDPEDLNIIFDNKIVNQDIFITHTDNEGTLPINYYIELEQVKLDLNEATVATLKDMRGRE
jgi:hypothetical protein